MGNVAIFKGKLVKFLAKAGILVPARPATERSLTPTAGETAFNTTVNKLEVYNGTTWTQLENGLVHPTTGSTYEASQFNISMTGEKNTTVGVNSGKIITDGYANTIFGYNSGTNLTTGDENTFVGSETASVYAVSGNRNVAIGYKAAELMQGGSFNVGVGSRSLSSIRYGESNVGIGNQAGSFYGPNSNYNTAINANGPSESETTLSGTVVIGRDNTFLPAQCTKNNEFVLGTVNHLYNFPGILQSGFRIGQSTNASSYVTLQSATTGTPVTWTLPVSNGNDGDVLTTNGSGTLSWLPGGGGGSSIVEELYAGNGLSYFNKILIINTTATFSGNFNNCIIYSTGATVTFSGTLYNCNIVSTSGIIEINNIYSCKIQAETIKPNGVLEDSELFATLSIDMQSTITAFKCVLNANKLQYLNDCEFILNKCIITITDARLDIINRKLRLSDCTASIANLYLFEGSSYRALELQNASRLNIGTLYHVATSSNLLLGINVISGGVNLKSTIGISTLTSTDPFTVFNAQLVSSSLTSSSSLLNIRIDFCQIQLVVSGGTHNYSTTSLNLFRDIGGGYISVGVRTLPTLALNSLSW